jgi:hypothetical protein
MISSVFFVYFTNLQSLETLRYGILSIIQVVVVAVLRFCHLEKNVQIKNFFILSENFLFKCKNINNKIREIKLNKWFK